MTEIAGSDTPPKTAQPAQALAPVQSTQTSAPPTSVGKALVAVDAEILALTAKVERASRLLDKSAKSAFGGMVSFASGLFVSSLHGVSGLAILGPIGGVMGAAGIMVILLSLAVGGAIADGTQKHAWNLDKARWKQAKLRIEDARLVAERHRAAKIRAIATPLLAAAAQDPDLRAGELAALFPDPCDESVGLALCIREILPYRESVNSARMERIVARVYLAPRTGEFSASAGNDILQVGPLEVHRPAATACPLPGPLSLPSPMQAARPSLPPKGGRDGMAL